MKEQLPLVMIVDGDEIHREMLENMLEDDVPVVSAKSYDECLGIIEYKKPDVFIIDPADPNVNGYKLCQELQERLSDNFAYLFLSSDDSFDARIKSYECGAQDFIPKPFQPAELLHKINLSLEAKQIQKNLKSDATEAMQTAMTAMKQSSDLGLVLQFMEESIKTGDYENLASVMISSLTQFSLEASIQILEGDEPQYYNCEVDSSEAHLMAMCKDKGRIVDVGMVTIVNGELVTLLIKEMPTEEARYGEVKDIIAIIINLSDAHAKSISTKQLLVKEQQFGLQGTIKKGQKKIEEMHQHIAKHSDQISKLMRTLKSKMRATLLQVNATEDQEAALLEMIDECLEEMEDAYSGIISIESGFAEVMEEMSKMIDK